MKPKRKQKRPPSVPGNVKGPIPTTQKKSSAQMFPLPLAASVLKALRDDDAQALKALIANFNPFRLAFPLKDGEEILILTASSAMGAWDCFSWLLEKLKTGRDYLNELGPRSWEMFDRDLEKATYLVAAAVRSKASRADAPFTNLLYLLYKISDDEGRQVLSEKFGNFEHFVQARLMVLSESETVSLDDPEKVRVPAPQENDLKGRGGKIL